MDTIYYHLNAKKVKVIGGADLVTLIPVAAPGSPEGRGEILDFARCRQRLETKRAWKDLTRAAQEVSYEKEREEAAAPQIPMTRRERAAGWMELCASAAVIAVSVAAALAFLRLL